MVLVFAFALVRRRAAARTTPPPAILWIAIAFSGTLALGRTFERERHGDTLRALLLAPADRPALYVGKLLGILLLLGLVELVLVPLVGAAVPGAAVRTAGAARSRCWSPGTLGFAAVGTLFAAMLVRARSRDVLLPILLYPITVPVMIAGVRGTAALLSAHARCRGRAVLDVAAGGVRRGLRHARALDVRAADDGLMATEIS